MGLTRLLKRNKNKGTAKTVLMPGMPRIIEVSKMTRERKDQLTSDRDYLMEQLEKTNVALNEQIISICTNNDIDFKTKSIKWDPTGSALIIADLPKTEEAAENIPGADQPKSTEAELIPSPEKTPDNEQKSEGTNTSGPEGDNPDTSGDTKTEI